MRDGKRDRAIAIAQSDYDESPYNPGSFAPAQDEGAHLRPAIRQAHDGILPALRTPTANVPLNTLTSWCMSRLCGGGAVPPTA